MLEIFKKIAAHNITPNAAMCLFYIKKKITPSTIDNDAAVEELLAAGFIRKDENKITIRPSGNAFIRMLDNYFTKAKKRTNEELMGKDFSEKISAYRLLFPAGKLPSGSPSRNNVKDLCENFRWFFETFDYSWDQVMSATRMYVKEYASNDYLYMQNSKYFIKKQDKHKNVTSSLADYCDMVKDGVVIDNSTPFDTKVV
ncbi:MAG: hypothetical protein HRT87_04485 [Legionellales bacterium]|nr:hypothetical protein [Legionellales bacterium]